MNTFTLTRRAKADLKSIAKFTEKRWGQEQRNIYIKQFDDTFNVLSGTPKIGSNCNYIKDNYEKFPQGSHIIYYRMTNQVNIQIIRILHKNMDVLSKFGHSSRPAHRANFAGDIIAAQRKNGDSKIYPVELLIAD
jgi:toxin ParE1/3/4